jgi:Beta-galactosidase
MIYFGAAYYTEYLPEKREEIDFRLMREAGINVIRIAESTWATYEPNEGEFDFSSVVRVLEKAAEYGLKVIIGTPTYAVPPWLAMRFPNVLAVTHQGPKLYGTRQNMDITNESYRFYAERVIRKLMEVVSSYNCVIGFQLDNETKHYDICSEPVQKQFVTWLQRRFVNIDALNNAFGLDYWSNRISTWEEFPDVRGAINGSLGCAFSEFQRTLVTDFLQWQANIVNEYARPDQFITHNFDFEWRGYSYGVQPDVDHTQASHALTLAGCDIYHASQDDLTGREIAFCGDLTRCLKNKQYIVIETQAQGFPHWTPYPGQLRLQAFSHIASGATGVMYWHWHSLHNAIETYWKGILSHDLLPNPVYDEIKTIGAEFEKLTSEIEGATKRNRAAMLVSNTALSAVDWFRIPIGVPMMGKRYNEVVRLLYDVCFDCNLELDIIFPDADLSGYDLLFVPCLYAAEDNLLQKLRSYVAQGGHLVSTFKTGFCDENIKVRTELQPGGLTDVFGCSYSQFTEPKGVTLDDGSTVEDWMELLTADSAQVLHRYDHPHWGQYAAITRNNYGNGTATYIGCMASKACLTHLLAEELKIAQIHQPEFVFPTIVRKMYKGGYQLSFVLNYSGANPKIVWKDKGGADLLTGKQVEHGDMLSLDPWSVHLLKSETPML